MKIRALLIGAKPLPFAGPWVPLGSGGVWRCVPWDDYDGKVVIEVSTGPCSLVTLHPLNGREVAFEGWKARAIIVEPFVGENVTVMLYGS